MSVRGWVYVLSNRAMPGLVKIGFSTKDPVLRVGELNGTGLPHSFDIEYDVLTNDPRGTEQDVHKRLAVHREAKEFFKVSPSIAIKAIRESIQQSGKPFISENSRETIAQNRPPELKSTNASSATPRRHTTVVKSYENLCPVCKAEVSGRDSRCPKCFTFLS